MTTPTATPRLRTTRQPGRVPEPEQTGGGDDGQERSSGNEIADEPLLGEADEQQVEGHPEE